jgi:hypothetical protein
VAIHPATRHQSIRIGEWNEDVAHSLRGAIGQTPKNLQGLLDSYRFIPVQSAYNHHAQGVMGLLIRTYYQYLP